MPQTTVPVDYAFFDTRMGQCAIAWGSSGVRSVLLPGENPNQMRRRLRLRLGDIREARPPREMRKAMSNIRQLLDGRSKDLSDIPLDLRAVPHFTRRVYQSLRRTEVGETLSYGELATRAGSPRAARAVGRAMANNPFPLIIPCHRVIAADGKPGAFSAPGGTRTKTTLLGVERQLARRSNRPSSRKPSRDLFHGGHVLDIDADSATEVLRRSDPHLARLIRRVGPFTLKLARTGSSFAALAEAIVYQQLAGSAAKAIFSRVKTQLAGRHSLKPEHVLDATTEKLRALGLSRNKTAALEDLANRALGGELPSVRKMRHLDDEAIIDALTPVRGIGRWTAEMLLIFRLGRPDVLPATDYGIRKGFALSQERPELPTPREVLSHAERWRPYRTVASWYLWRALDQSGVRSDEVVGAS